jgi:formylglycine-generating enzyme required for sulfatase activity
MTANVPKSSRVFISYSRESSQHNKRVLELSNLLCYEGINCNIDEYEDSPPEGWFLWMINQIEEADFVLIVCTEKYERRFMGKVEAGKGLGAKLEGAIITQEMYYQKASNKCIPIVYSPEDFKYIPVILKGFTYYDLSEAENYDRLYARLTGQKLVSKPPIGKLRYLEPKHSSSVPTVKNQEVKLAESKQKPVIGNLKTIGEEDKTIEVPNIFTSPSTGMEFILIPAGWFIMGSSGDEVGRYDDEGPPHKVTIKNPFYLGKYPVTQRQWIAVMANNPSSFKDDDLPVESVSWNDVQEFIKRLNEMEGNEKYRLPSEAEWEYTCRSRKRTRYSFGNDESKLGDYAWYRDDSGGKTHPIGQKKPNDLDLYDLHGNVWEWVQDKWHDDYNGAPSDGSAWENGNNSDCVVRGGGWNNDARGCRSAIRQGNDPGNRLNGVGFRLLRAL